MKKYSLGIVLSGGSVRGVGHIGLIKCLEELKVTPQMISGTSAGALIGAFYAAGIKTDEMLSFFKSTPLFKYNSINPLKAGIFDLDKYMGMFKGVLPETFEELNIPLVVCATNLLTGEAEYFNSGPLLRPILASCSIPFVFSPVKIEDKKYIDGAIQDNFPIEQIRDQCQIVIGSSVNNPGEVDVKKVNSLFKVTDRSFNLLIYATMKHKFKLADQVLEHPLQDFGYFDTKKIQAIFDLSYDFSKENLDQKIIAKVQESVSILNA